MKPWIALLGLLAAGCISTSNTPPLQYYVLTDTGRAPEARRASLDGSVLLVQPTSVSAFYDTQRLVYSRAPGERAYYQFAAWTERPGRAFAELLSRRLGARSPPPACAATWCCTRASRSSTTMRAASRGA